MSQTFGGKAQRPQRKKQDSLFQGKNAKNQLALITASPEKATRL